MDEQQFILYLRQQGLLLADSGAQSKMASKKLGMRARVYKIVLPDTDAEQVSEILDRIADCPEAVFDEKIISIPADVLRDTNRATALELTDDFDLADFVEYTQHQKIMTTMKPEQEAVWRFCYSCPMPMTEEERKELASGWGSSRNPSRSP